MTVVGRGLIVSLTPTLDSPWRSPDDIRRLAVAAVAGGAVAVKVDGPAAVAAVRAELPELTLLAVAIEPRADRVVQITPTAAHAARLVDAGADVVELEADAAARRADGQDVAEIIAAVAALGRPVKAGVGGVEDARLAVAAGARLVSSSTMGYTVKPGSRPLPDLDLVSALVADASVPVVAERGYSAPAELFAAFERGAHAVVVGSAIVDPVWTTRRFAAAVPEASR